MGGNTIYHNVNIPPSLYSNYNNIGKCQTQNSLLALLDLKYVRQTRKWTAKLLNWSDKDDGRLLFSSLLYIQLLLLLVIKLKAFH